MPNLTGDGTKLREPSPALLQTWLQAWLFLGGPSSLIGPTGTMGLLAAVLELQANALEHREEVEHRKREAAFRYIDKWETAASFFSPMRELGTFAKDNRDPSQIDSFLKASGDRMNAWLTVSSLFETIGLAVKTEFADEASLCAFFGGDDAAGPAMTYFTDLKPWIDFRRQGPLESSMLEHYEWVYKRWRKGCRDLPVVD